MNKPTIEELLPLYFEGNLSEGDRLRVMEWAASSEENKDIFEDSKKAWKGIDFLRTMKKYDSGKALQKVHGEISRKKYFLPLFQKIAAILILPLFITTLYIVRRNPPLVPANETAEWNTITTPAGIRSEFILPDNTKVYLNSKTSLSYPVAFNGKTRDIVLNGEAYFEVAKDTEHPFIINAGKINIEVTGTKFKASNYNGEGLIEIVLVSGGIDLFQGEYSGNNKKICHMLPGERACFKEPGTKVHIDKVNVNKYISWKDGILMFRDDSMEEVVRRLNRWFNVDIKLTGEGLSDYVYTATFEDESLMQILDLLKISAPIDYSVKKREREKDETFSKMEITITQK